MNSKYSNFLTILLVLIIIAILGIIGFLGFKFYKSYTTKNEGEDFAETWGDQVQNSGNNINIIPPDENDDGDENVFAGVDDTSNDGSSTSNKEAPKYNGFETAGTIEIPTTNL